MTSASRYSSLLSSICSTHTVHANPAAFDVRIAEMLYTTNLVALVTGETTASVSKFTIFDIIKSERRYESEMSSEIKAIKMYKNG